MYDSAYATILCMFPNLTISIHIIVCLCKYNNYLELVQYVIIGLNVENHGMNLRGMYIDKP